MDNKFKIKDFLLSSVMVLGLVLIIEVFADFTSEDGLQSLKHYLLFACKAVPITLLIEYFASLRKQNQ